MINTKAYMNYINDIIKCLYNRRIFFNDSSVKGLILLCMIDITYFIKYTWRNLLTLESGCIKRGLPQNEKVIPRVRIRM